MAGFQDLRVYRKANFAGARTIGLQPNIWGAGKVYWVDSASWGKGKDGNSGLDPDQPLAKIQTAGDKCVDGNHDYVVVLNSWDNDAVTIDLDRTCMHVIGVSPKQHAAPGPWIKIAGTGAAACFTLHGAQSSLVEIAGFSLGASSSKPCITCSLSETNYSTFCSIHDIAFANSTDTAYTAQDGILIASGMELTGGYVYDCTFGAQISRDGIRIEEGGGFTGGRVENCSFKLCTTTGVHHAGTSAVASMCDVLGCYFQAAHNASEGWAVNIYNSSGGLIAGNLASADFTTADANPYLDHSDKCQWGLNYNVITATAPATT